MKSTTLKRIDFNSINNADEAWAAFKKVISFHWKKYQGLQSEPFCNTDAQNKRIFHQNMMRAANIELYRRFPESFSTMGIVCVMEDIKRLD